ncbi:substrate-binding domain-containing protein [Pelagibius marinus]|uniref:substrate-binding domain-containing protein n=1 Tax=Pelagibius marinus TaxID=2762760 RepID=UPI001872692B|nr:substrate-binding domain-containing protein [Pelagibius marinus]
MIRRSFLTLTLLGAAAATAAGLAFTGPSQAEDKFIVVQSTTSTQNSGLYDYLLPIFTRETGVEVRVVAVGTGQAIKNAQNCDGDVLLVHAKASEEKFVAAGYGVSRADVMYNDFVIVGPGSDPAGIAGGKDVTAALTKIKDSKAVFASRGDDSGTNKKEMALWKAAGIDPTADSGSWYRETGSGMGATLNASVGMGAYTMSDRATWIAFGNKGDFEIAVEGDERLFNQYGVILVNPETCANVKADLGQAFINWILSDEGQSAIADYRRDGKQLFFPNAKMS